MQASLTGLRAMLAPPRASVRCTAVLRVLLLALNLALPPAAVLADRFLHAEAARASEARLAASRQELPPAERHECIVCQFLGAAAAASHPPPSPRLETGRAAPLRPRAYVRIPAFTPGSPLARGPPSRLDISRP